MGTNQREGENSDRSGGRGTPHAQTELQGFDRDRVPNGRWTGRGIGLGALTRLTSLGQQHHHTPSTRLLAAVMTLPRGRVSPRWLYKARRSLPVSLAAATALAATES